MKVTKVIKDLGFARTTINSRPYVGVFGLTITADEVSYRLEVNTPGKLPGEKFGDQWRVDEAIINLHRLTTDFDEVKVTSEEAKQIASTLRDIASGEQAVTDKFDEPIETNAIKDDLSFIEPLLERGARLFEGKKIVSLGEIKQIRSQVEKPLPRA